MGLRKLLNDCITGPDGVTVDPARLYGAFAVLAFLGVSIYSVVFNHAVFDAQGYGIGFGALLVGFGVGVQVKHASEPPAPPEPPL